MKLARRNGVALPADTEEGLRDWYRFRDFPHFVEVYVAVSKCVKTPDDLELILREFLEGQVEQNILHTEITFTASTIEKYGGIPWREQHPALLRALRYGAEELGVSAGLILDIVRGCPEDWAVEVAEWATTGEGVVALGLAGEEVRGTSPYTRAFAVAHDRGFPIVPHAGETLGPASIWEVLELTRPKRIGHGVRCLEDPGLTMELAEKGIPLEVCPSSNVALGVFSSLEEHPLPRMLDAGLYVTLNSDDPPMFGTSLSEEFQKCSEAFGFNEDIVWSLCLNAARASLLPEDRKADLIARMRSGFSNTVSLPA